MNQPIHPFRHGLLMAVVLAVCSSLLGVVSLAPLYQPSSGDLPRMLFAVAIVPGAFLASVPGRFRAAKQARVRAFSWKGCLFAFACGLVMTLCAALTDADDLRMFTGAMQGGLGALGFTAAAWLSACIAVRLIRRRQRV